VKLLSFITRGLPFVVAGAMAGCGGPAASTTASQSCDGGSCPGTGPCVSGGCTGVCAPGATQCNGGAQTCDLNGQWGSPAPCAYGCVSGACVGVGSGAEGGVDGQADAGPAGARDASAPSTATIYVSDANNQRIQRFDSNAVYGSQFGFPYSPTALALDAQGNMYVRDAGACTVKKYDPQGNLLLSFGSCGKQFGGTGPGIFDGTAAGLAVDAQGNIWVPSPAFYYIQKYDSIGEFVQIVCMDNGGVAGCSQATPFEVQPMGIALDANGNIYVTNVYPGAENVVKLDAAGYYVSSFGSSGIDNGQFKTPEAIGIDPAGDIYVVDSGNNRVQKFSSSGVYASQFGFVGSGDGQFEFPQGIAFDSSGDSYVVDLKNNRVQVFSPSGAYLSQFGGLGTATGQFSQPYGIVIR
jgi:tripartite motif-containing protein 71